MVIGGNVTGEGWVLLRMLLRGDAVVYGCVLVWSGCGGGLSPCVVNRFWWAYSGDLLRFLIFFSLYETCTLLYRVAFA